MNSKMKKTFMLLGATAALASCVDDLGLNAPNKSKLDQVYFTASIAEQDFFGAKKAQTRSAEEERQRVEAGYYDLAIDGRNDIHLSVATLDGMFGKPAPMPEDGKDNAKTRGAMLARLAQKPMTVVEYAKTSDGKTIVGEPYTAYTNDGETWGGSHIQQSSNATSRTLHAIYPNSESYTIDAAAGTVAYTTPNIASKQSDLLYAYTSQSLGTEIKDQLHLTFDHLLTAVRFKIGSQQLPMSVIKSITIDGIQTSGTFNLSKGEWNLANNDGSVTCNLDFDVTGVYNTIVNGGENTFMLLPQQLTPNAKVIIKYEDNTYGGTPGETQTLTASLATGNTPKWEAGQCITYTLLDHTDNGEYFIEVDAPADFSPAFGEQEINVVSYHMSGNVRTPMRWMVQSFSTDGGKSWMSGGANNVPKGMSMSPTESSEANTKVRITLMATDTIFAPHGDFLRNKTPLGCRGEAFDLSCHDYLNKPCAQTTANCYVVDAPGKYRIPTAYGNGIVNGSTNKDAYTDNAGYKNCDTKNNFMAHNGNAITAPMIQNNGIRLSRATLVWEDVKDLIDPKSIKLVDDGNAIEFEILADNIDQGNAVIAAMDGNTVAWSWHIWVTDEKASLAEPITDNISNNESVDFMPLTLGWCSNADAKGALGRDVTVRLVMPDHLSKQACFNIHQKSTPAYDIMGNTDGNATYYNWGRKDPFPGAKGPYVSNGSSENADDLPKDFYQAGADAAALGLHAELHAEYSADWKSLLIEGALVGLDGFMTGTTIKQVMNQLKNVKGYTNSAADIVNESEIAIESKGTYQGGLKKYSWGEDGPQSMFRVQFDQKGMAAHIVECTEKNNGYFQEQFVGIGGHKTPIRELKGAHFPASRLKLVETKKWGVGLYVYDKDLKTPTEFLEIRVVGNPRAGNFSFYSHAVVSGPRVTPHLALGNFSGALMSTIHQTLSDKFSLGAAFANASMFKGGTEWCRQMSAHGVSVNYGIQHPNILMRDPISWVEHDGVGNLWNTSQTNYDDPNTAVVKSIYDPCPAGYCVPSQKDMSRLEDATTERKYRGGTQMITSSGDVLMFPGLGMRNFWSGAEPGSAANNNINDQIMFIGAQGLYWTASPAINENEKGEKGAYAVNFRGSESVSDYGEKGYKYTPRVVNNLKLQTSYALPIRPVREK